MKRIVLACVCLLALSLCALASAEVPVSSVTATSWIVGSDPNAYIPAQMIDGDETTAFQFSTRTTPLGQEYVYFTLAKPSEVSALWIKNGFLKTTNGLDQYTRNSRVKTMTVSFLYSGASVYTDAQTVSLPDVATPSSWTVISLGSHSGVTSILFRIDAIYQGSRYPNDVCISEVRFASADEPAPVAELYGLAIDRLATRRGPGTNYEGGGTYSVKGQYIKVLSRAWDSRNSIWWVKCEIPYRNEIRVLWTGYKRFDSSTLPLESIPLESANNTYQTPTPTAAAGWGSAYRSLITSRQYTAYQHSVLSDPAYEEMLQSRDQSLDCFALYDFNHDGTPELLVVAVYGFEQADVFTCQNGSVVWLGVMGGDNFFQDFLYLSNASYPGLYTLTGGPAMDVTAYWLYDTTLSRQTVARTLVNSEGDDTIGIQMTVADSDLQQLLYDRLVTGTVPMRTLNTYSLSDLTTDAQWNAFYAAAIY